MDKKIPTSELAAMLALATGKQKELCEKFVSQLFSVVDEELTKGENVRIKGFGTFKLVEVEPRKSVNVVTGEDYEIPGHTKVIFVMSKELAAIVNAPFEAFEAVEIADELPTDDLDGDIDIDGSYVKGTDVESSDVNEPDAIASMPVAEIMEEIITEEKNDAEEAAEMDDAPVEAEDTLEIEETPEIEEIPDTEETSEMEEVEDSEEAEEYVPFWKRYKFIIGFIAGMCASVLIGWLAISLADYLKPSSQSEKEITEIEEITSDKILVTEVKDSVANKVDSVGGAEHESYGNQLSEQEEVPTKPSDEPVYDTVSTTRYLTTIAQQHYGNFNLWPIIYEENASILGHPDRIRPGTKVVVPPLTKYGIDPQNKEHIKKVKEKGRAIYAKYK